MQFLLKIFRSVLNLLSAELPDSRGIFVRLESQTVWLKNDDWICTWSRKLHDRPLVHRTSHPADERDTLYKDWTLDTTHFYCPLVTLKWKSDDLFFAWYRKLHDGARSPRLGARSVWQPADERVTARSKTVHITLLLPLSGVLCLESVMSDKMCVCVCVCVCVHRQFSTQAGFPNRFLCSAPLFGIFDVSQCTCSQNQCLFPLPLLVPIALLSNVYAATAIISYLVKYGFSSGASIRSRTLPWILYKQNPSTMKCSRGQLRNNGACCARENAHVRFQLRTAFRGHMAIL